MLVGNVGKLSEIGGGDLLADLKIVISRNISDAKVYLIEVARFRKLLQMLDGIHAKHLTGESQQRAAAHARTAQVFGFGASVLLRRVNQRRARSHTDHDRLVKPRQIQSAKPYALELGHLAAVEVIDGLFHKGRADARHQDTVNVRKGKPVLHGKFAKCAVYRGNGIGGADEQRFDQLTLVSFRSESDDLRGASSYVYSDYGSHGISSVVYCH